MSTSTETLKDQLRAAMTAAMKHLEPHFLSGDVKPRGTIVLGTVKGDLHDIGKKIVSLFFQGGGWKVIDLGVDVSTEKFLAAIETHQPAAVGLSALLTTTMLNMEKTIQEAKAKGTRLLLPLAPDYQDEIRRFVSATTGLDLEFARVGASWPIRGALCRLQSRCLTYWCARHRKSRPWQI
jgi:methylmalonyl-CoA mutase cobalamin-binding subunit